MIDYFLPIMRLFLYSDLFSYFFAPFIALCFIATVPCVIRYMFALGGR